VKATKGKAYISITLELIRAKTSSMQIRNNQVAIILLAIVNGFFVEINKPAKKDCDIPIYNTGSIFTMKKCNICYSNITKRRLYYGIFGGLIFNRPKTYQV